MAPAPKSPFGTKTRILLTSVFGPYAQDDEYGGRAINPMELYQNQVTRVQGVFSLRMFHRSFGLMMLQSNIEAPCTLVDFPSRDEFINVLEDNTYDIVGVSAIIPNTGKVVEMCRLIRKHQPRAVIVIGGHIANRENLAEIIDADFIVKGDGIRWFRRYLGQDEEAPVRHPAVLSGFGSRVLGVQLPNRPKGTAAMLIPSVGCPVGCNFCSTSAMFGGKGKAVLFFKTGDELFEVMNRIESELGVNSFFIMDENFLFHRKRALRLLELMQQAGKSWRMYVFSSAKVLTSYSMDQLIGLGISWVWMGLEGQDSQYAKMNKVNTKQLVKTLRENGIVVLGSSIIGLENHTPENIDQVIKYAVSHETDFHQFMLYTPISGTPLHEEHRRANTLLEEPEIDIADTHGQYRFNFRHRHIPAGAEEEYLRRAFKTDFKVNGPSLARLIDASLKGWRCYKNHPDARIRNRYTADALLLKTSYPGAVWAMRKWYRTDQAMRAKLDNLLHEYYTEFGLIVRLAAPAVGLYIFRMMKREEKRLAAGWSYEPRSFIEKNTQMQALEKSDAQKATPLKPKTGYSGVAGVGATSK